MRLLRSYMCEGTEGHAYQTGSERDEKKGEVEEEDDGSKGPFHSAHKQGRLERFFLPQTQRDRRRRPRRPRCYCRVSPLCSVTYVQVSWSSSISGFPHQSFTWAMGDRSPPSGCFLSLNLFFGIKLVESSLVNYAHFPLCDRAIN